MKLEASIDGRKWIPLKGIYALEGFLEGVFERLPENEVKVRWAK